MYLNNIYKKKKKNWRGEFLEFFFTNTEELRTS